MQFGDIGVAPRLPTESALKARSISAQGNTLGKPAPHYTPAP